MEKPNEDVVKRFFNSTCDENEYSSMMNYLNSLKDDELQIFMDSHIKKIENEEINVENSYTPNFGTILSRIRISRINHYFFKHRTFYSVAVSIIFLIILSTSLFNYSEIFTEKTDSVVWNEKVTMAGERSILTFQDGTRITLNAESVLRYPTGSKSKIWEVYLYGEAYFEVHHDTSRYFVVHTGKLKTSVLGTKFNINAFPEDNTITVSLVSGKVQVSKNENGLEEGLVVLEPKQQLLYNKENNISAFSQFDYQKAVGWKDNTLKFDDEPLEKVFVKLERAYGVKFELTNKAFGKIKITTKLDDNPLWAVAEVIKKLTGLEYKTIKENTETKKIIFFKK